MSGVIHVKQLICSCDIACEAFRFRLHQNDHSYLLGPEGSEWFVFICRRRRRRGVELLIGSRPLITRPDWFAAS